MTPAVLTPAERVARLPELRRVLTQLSPQLTEVSDDELAGRLSDDRLVLVVLLEDDQVVGATSLSLLMEAVHDEARRLGLRHVDLTSRPSREAANALYRSLGYEQRETNAYRLRL